MTSFFGPEIPEPFCVTSERHISSALDQLMAGSEQKALRKKYEKRFNELEHHASLKYEKDLCGIINKYLEIDCDHDVLFMRCEGDETARDDGQEDLNDPYTFDWPAIIARKFCLTKPVDQCVVSEPRFKSETRSLLNPNLSLTSGEILAQEAPFECKYLSRDGKTSNKNAESTPKKYDKIIFKNCLKFFEPNSKYFCEYVMTLFKDPIQFKTSLLFIQRVHDLNTLPFYHQIHVDWSQNDARYSKFMQDMQNEFFSIKFDIEVLKCLIDCKSTWYRLLKEKHPYPLKQRLLVDEDTVSKRNELVHGIRELDEGLFKYQKYDNVLEFNDRLLFIGAYHEKSRTATLAERIRESKVKKKYNFSTDLAINDEINKLSMEITPEMQAILKQQLECKQPPSKLYGRRTHITK